jgi:hypothetical protein
MQEGYVVPPFVGVPLIFRSVYPTYMSRDNSVKCMATGWKTGFDSRRERYFSLRHHDKTGCDGRPAYDCERPIKNDVTLS